MMRYVIYHFNSHMESHGITRGADFQNKAKRPCGMDGQLQLWVSHTRNKKVLFTSCGSSVAL